jgi:serine/threonine-protein kinase
VPESFAEGLVGVVLDDRYRLDAVLGEGGMGAVYRAHHLAMDRKVAVKLLKPHLTSDDSALQRFMREARSTMKVDSDHAVKVLDFGITPQRDYYMVLEYLDGRTVQRELDVDGPFTPARAIHVAKQALLALGAAHGKGLIHRDIKPDNILLLRVGDDPDFTKVLDFGVAKLMEGAATSSKSALSITQAGMVFGTPEFMSPEQACGQPLDARSDLYSLAATMFAMLTGCGLFRASSAIEWLTHHARTPPPHLAEALPALAPFTALDAVLQTCLAKRKEQRPATAAEMAALLASCEGSMPAASSVPTPRGPGVPSIDSPRRSASLRAPAKPGLSIASPSSYIEAIAADATLVPPAAADTAPARPRARAASTGPSTSSLLARSQGSRRGVWLALGGSAILAVLVTTAIVASRTRTRESAVASKQTEPPAPDAERVAVASATVDAGGDDADAPLDAGHAAADAGTRVTAVVRPRVNAEAAPHVAAAEQARTAGNRLRQLAEADAALQADPRNVRARFLFADALIASGDLERGCKYLRDLRKNPTARARSRQAGCPTN